MNQTMTYLKQIESLLEQIENITQNQTTVLLHQLDEDKEEALSYIEEMVNFKDKVIGELTEAEAAFQSGYHSCKEELISSGLIREVKNSVAKILETKERITRQEQNNLHLLNNKVGSKPERVEIRPNAYQVLSAYKQNQAVTKS